MSDTGQTVLEIRGLDKAFGDHRVLHGIDLDLHEHEVVAVIGSSGSGKSTLLRCLNLTERPDAGQIRFDGQDIMASATDVDRIRRHIGIVFQAYNLFPHLTVAENLALGPQRVLRISKREAHARGEELLERIGLADKHDAYPDRLSGGQQQRVAIARALAMRPRVLLLDEITAALDPELVGEVLLLVRELAEGGMTMFIATHEMAFARDVAHRVAFLDAGRLAEVGPASQVLTDPREERTRAFLRRVLTPAHAAGPEAGPGTPAAPAAGVAAVPATDAIGRWRADLPALLGRVYLNAGTAGPLRATVAAAMREALDRTLVAGRIGTEAEDREEELREAARAGAAALLGADPEDVALAGSTTDGLNRLVLGVPWTAGDRVVTTAHEHPAALLALRQVAERQGVRLQTWDPTGPDALDALAALLREPVRAVVVSHVLWTTGQILDVARIGALAQAAGALLLVDGAQAVGHVDVDVRQGSCDGYALAAHKWLCGPEGIGAVYLSPAAQTALRPTWPTYFALSDDAVDSPPRPGARRFDAPTLAEASLAGLVATAAAHRDRPPDADLGAQLAHLRTGLAAAGLAPVPTPGPPSRLVAIDAGGDGPADALVARLEHHGVIVRSVPGHGLLRLSVGPWTTTAELDRAVALLASPPADPPTPRSPA